MGRKFERGFSLPELLIVAVLILVLVIIVFNVLNPRELTRRARDAARISDIVAVSKAISFVVLGSEGKKNIFCNRDLPPCLGESKSNLATIRNADGLGWVKVNFLKEPSLQLPVLPIDPINDLKYFYSYYSDGKYFELNAILESDEYKFEQTRDGGDNPNIYEAGTKLTLLN